MKFQTKKELFFGGSLTHSNEFTPLFFTIEIAETLRSYQSPFRRAHKQFAAIGRMTRLSSWIIGNDIDNKIFAGIIRE
jgi:hypothetical protein